MEEKTVQQFLSEVRRGNFFLLTLLGRSFFFPRSLSKGPLGAFLSVKSEESWLSLFDKVEYSPLYLPDPEIKEKRQLLVLAGHIEKAPLPITDWAEEFLSKILYRANGLYYRMESSNGGGSPEEGSSDWMKREAFLWKKANPIFWEHDLTPEETVECERAASYKRFQDLLVRFPKIAERFFSWIIRDHLPADIFIEYPKVVDEIYRNHLAGRIGTVSGSKLKIRRIREGNKIAKFVTLPFEGREVNILEPDKKVLLRGGMEKSVAEYFDLFRIKEQQFVDVEFFAEGICNWNSQYLGIWNEKKKVHEVIDIEDREWWRQLPPVEILSLEEGMRRFGEGAKEGIWCVSAKAARQYLNLDYSRCHAYLEVAIPMKDHYAIYEFGKFAREFPYGVVDDMKMFTRTTLATVAYPDENIYHTARQHASYTFFLNHYEGLALMEEIRKDIVHAREKNMVFQFESDNCAHWIQTHLEELLGKERVPNLFRVALLDSEPKGPVGFLFRFVSRCPQVIQAKIFQVVHFPFGAWRGRFVVEKGGKKVYKSLIRTNFWKDNIVYLPAYLHRQRESGALSSAEGAQDSNDSFGD